MEEQNLNSVVSENEPEEKQGADELFSDPNEEEAVAENSPAPIQSQSTNGNRNRPKPKSRQLGWGFFLGCFGVFFFLFALFVIFLVIAIKTGGVSSPFLTQFGMDLKEMKGFLAVLVNLSFGALSLILFLLFVTSVFRLFLIRKEDKQKRRRLSFNTILTFFLTVVVMLIWVAVYYNVATIVGDNRIEAGSILVFNAENDQAISTLNLVVPIKVKFKAQKLSQTDGLKYEIVSYQWDLDGDSKFTEGKSGEEVGWEYKNKQAESKPFQVTLKMTLKERQSGNLFEKITTRDMSIASVRPWVQLKVDPQEGSAPLTVKFDASASLDVDGKITDFAWEFNDDSKFDDAMGDQATRTFEQIGIYPVALRVTDDDGNYSVEKIEINVKKPEIIIQAKITADLTAGSAPLLVNLDAGDSTSKAGRVTKFEWNFNDGTSLDRSRNPQHTFTKPGAYNVELVVTDEFSNQGKVALEIKVEGGKQAPVAVIGTLPVFKTENGGKFLEGEVPFEVEFKATQSFDPNDDIVEYAWDLEGKNVYAKQGETVQFAYYTKGDYQVSLRVTDSAGNQAFDELNIKVGQKDLFALIKTDVNSGSVPLLVEFDGSTSVYANGKIEKYQWDFGDGTAPILYDAKIKHLYDRIGIFEARLVVITEDGKQAATAKRIVVTQVPVRAKFTPSLKNGTAPLSITFDSSASTGTIVKYQWDFSDGVVSSERKPAHIFRESGSYVVTLRVIDRQGIVDSYSETIEVK
ncbi:hypothetical protein COT40_01345 [Candidatus Peregrinibacteria bacterium CG08_land_8_20_14_0_20_41_10]|nr:MAG: hypothetical protein COT40_01345 [Candidatus Peregrinibacteria bacterium CG08_land_8_20_14_0_20_41_10]